MRRRDLSCALAGIRDPGTRARLISLREAVRQGTLPEAVFWTTREALLEKAGLEDPLCRPAEPDPQGPPPEELPAWLAHPWAACRAATAPRIRLHWLRETAAAALRLSVAVALAEVRRARGEILPPPLREALLPELQRPSLRGWLQALTALAGAAPAKAYLAGGVFQLPRSVFTAAVEGPGGLARAREALLRGPVPNEEVARRLSQGLPFVIEILAEMRRVLSGRRTLAVWKGRAYHLQGLETEPVERPEELPAEASGVYLEGSGRFLLLSPLLEFAPLRPGDTEPTPLLFSAWEPGAVRYTPLDRQEISWESPDESPFETLLGRREEADFLAEARRAGRGGQVHPAGPAGGGRAAPVPGGRMVGAAPPGNAAPPPLPLGQRLPDALAGGGGVAGCSPAPDTPALAHGPGGGPPLRGGGLPAAGRPAGAGSLQRPGTGGPPPLVPILPGTPQGAAVPRSRLARPPGVTAARPGARRREPPDGGRREVAGKGRRRPGAAPAGGPAAPPGPRRPGRGVLQVWNLEERERLHTFSGHTDCVNGVLLLPEGRLLSWGDDGMLFLRPLDAGEITLLRGHRQGIQGACRLGRNRLLSWSNDRTLRIWDPTSGRSRLTLTDHTHGVKGARVLPDGRIVSWSHDGILRTWDPESGECLRVLEGHTGWVTGAAPLGEDQVVSWSHDGTFRIWDLESRVCLDTLPEEAAPRVHPALLIAREARRPGPETLVRRPFVAWSRDGAAGLSADLPGGGITALWRSPAPVRVHHLFPDGTLAVSHQDGRLHFLRPWRGRRRLTLEEIAREVYGLSPEPAPDALTDWL